MKKLLIAAAVAAAAAVPGVIGLAGNASFAQSVPVQVPAGASTMDDPGRHAERGPAATATSGGSDDGQAPVSGTAGDDGSRHGGHDDGSADR